MNTTIYKTSDFLTASVLLLLKHVLISTDTSDTQRVVFLFTNSNRLQDDLITFQRGELLVDPADFWAAERRCKQIIFGGKRL